MKHINLIIFGRFGSRTTINMNSVDWLELEINLKIIWN